jgi:uncharacterized membrane protein
MSASLAGLAVGAVLAFAILVFGFWGFLLVVLFMAIGLLVGRFLDGKLDPRGLANALSGKRSS